MPTVETAVSKVPTETYEEWLGRGRKLAAEHNDRNWLLGDWLNEGEEFDFQNLGIPSYLLIGSHPPNFWKMVSEEVDLAVGTLKNLALVARRFPADKRISALSWSHHMAAAPYERRFEYLAACIDGPGKPRSIEWLLEYIAKNEEPVEKEERHSIPLYLPLSLVRKMKDVAHYRHKELKKIAFEACNRAIQEYLAAEERQISLELFDCYEEGVWPLAPGAELRYKIRRRK